jgi:hypothetical protein
MEWTADIARWKTEAKLVHELVSWNHHIIFEIRDIYTDSYINTFSSQIKSPTKRAKELRLTCIANLAPSVIPLT